MFQLRVGRAFAVALCAAWTTAPGFAANALIAVATNFAETAAELETGFESQSWHTVLMTTGSTGKLYAQIVQGAPFDVLLAADAERPRLLAERGLAVQSARSTYAVGRLTLWSADPDLIRGDGAAVLRAAQFRRLAVANPDLAPYGAASYDVIAALGLGDVLRGRIVLGENIGQTYAHVATGNAELGFVARAQVVAASGEARGSRWEVPDALHRPIRQDGVLLRRGADNLAAVAFLEYLHGADGRRIIQRYGYRVD